MGVKTGVAKGIGKIWLWAFIIVALFSVLGIAWKLLMAPLNLASTAITAAGDTTTGVIKQTLNADNALDKYRKFHNLYQGMEKHKANYDVYEVKVAGFKEQMGGVPYAVWSSGDKEQFNFMRDTQSNFKLAYNRAAAKYNELASRMDAKFFKNADYLPLLGLDEPLPDEVPLLR